MLSFIVIGHNEGWKISECISGIIATVKHSDLSEYEIIYVDSNSSDDSIARAKTFNEVIIIKLIADYNPAIARNVGFSKSCGNVLFFVDGDMILQPEFLEKVYSKEKGLIADFVSGNWINHFYNTDGILIDNAIFKSLSKDSIEKVTGGLFLINRSVYEIVGGMDPRFRKSQDIDLGLRLARKGIYLLRKKDIAAIHNTVSYTHKSRTWKEMWKHMYGRSFLYRKHILNPVIYSRFIRNEYSLLLLIICSCIFTLTNNYSLFWLYIVVILLRSHITRKLNLNLIAFLISRDILVFFGFFFFYPKRKFNIKYTVI